MRHRQLRSNDVAGMTGNYTAIANFEKPSDKVAVIQEFLTNWTVPSAPEFPHCLAHVNIWNGLQDYKGENLMQPVLSWIPISMSWQAGCFYYIDGVQYNGEAVRVKPGDELQGRITFDGKTGENYTYSMEFAEKIIRRRALLLTCQVQSI
jgi:hypothetical protein